MHMFVKLFRVHRCILGVVALSNILYFTFYACFYYAICVQMCTCRLYSFQVLFQYLICQFLTFTYLWHSLSFKYILLREVIIGKEARPRTGHAVTRLLFVFMICFKFLQLAIFICVLTFIKSSINQVNL